MYKTSCPIEKSPPTKWYQLEVFWNTNYEDIGYEISDSPGRLHPVFHASDIYPCQQDTVTYICTCLNFINVILRNMDQ